MWKATSEKSSAWAKSEIVRADTDSGLSSVDKHLDKGNVYEQ